MRDGDSPLCFGRYWAMPSADTFSIKPINAFVRKYAGEIVVDPFARNSEFATHSNDLNPGTKATHHMLATDFLKQLADEGLKADTVLLDPPYSPRQISECYKALGLTVSMKDTQSSFYSEIRALIRPLCKRGTFVLSFGWNSTGMGHGFDMREIRLVAHGGAHNDTICIAEECLFEEHAA